MAAMDPDLNEAYGSREPPGCSGWGAAGGAVTQA